MRFYHPWLVVQVWLLAALVATAHVDHARDIISDIVSFGDSIFGITTTDSGSSTIVDSPVSTDVQTTTPVVAVTTATPVSIVPPSTPTITTITVPPPSFTSTTTPGPATITSINSPKASIIPSAVPTESLKQNSKTSISSVTYTPARTSQPLPSPTLLPTQSSTKASKVSPAGLAVAVIFSIIIVGLVIYMIAMYHSRTNKRLRTLWYRLRKHDAADGDVEKDENYGIVDARAVKLTPINPQYGNGLGLRYIEKSPKPSSDDELIYHHPSPKRQRARSRRFSFQFTAPQSPRRIYQPGAEVRRKPVGGQDYPPPPGVVGLAVPMSSPRTQRKQGTKRWSGMQILRRISGLHEMA